MVDPGLEIDRPDTVDNDNGILVYTSNLLDKSILYRGRSVLLK